MACSTPWYRPDGSGRFFPKEINMIRTIAAALAAFCLVSFGAFAQAGSAGTSTDTGTSAKTETKSDTAGMKSKKHKKSKKAKKADSAAKSDSSSSATPK
jgi:hypothetical protein